MKNWKLFMVLLAVGCILLGCIGTKTDEQNGLLDQSTSDLSAGEKQVAKKLYWFIPDGMRADPDLFTVFQWAEEGKLPNIKRLMEMGSYGYCIPTFPSHTPTNFATLLTGTYPEVHGVADGPMHVEGYSLAKPSVAGFSSAARKVPAIWSVLESAGKSVVVLSIPGSTPPELRNGIIIRGRWGGWGADFYSYIFEKKSVEQRKKIARASRLFFFGYELTKFIDPVNDSGWVAQKESFSEPLYLEMDINGGKVYAKVVDSTDDSAVNYDRIVFSPDKQVIAASLAEGEWSEWMPLTMKWNDKDVPSHVKINVIKLDDDGFFRIRATLDNLNKYVVQPGEVSDELVRDVGPMVDFVDNFPPQLIYYDEDKKTFLEESNMSFQWHRDAVGVIYDNYNPDVFIQDIYSPNQMLTSRWWMGYIDPKSARYNDVSPEEREKLWTEVMDMYTQLDDIVGEALKNADDNTLIILSSDHGAVPLDKSVKLNNLFAQKGWVNYTFNEQTGEPIIDWQNTKVFYMKMDNVYVNPNGLGVNWTRGSGPEYEKLRDEVIDALSALADEDGSKPLSGVFRWEDVEEFLDLPKDRVGDLVVANHPGFGWDEELTPDGQVFKTPLITGYKQAIYARNTTGMWTPFIIAGPGVKKNHRVEEPIEMVDQFPTILVLMGQEVPDYVQGHAVEEIFE